MKYTLIKTNAFGVVMFDYFDTLRELTDTMHSLMRSAFAEDLGHEAISFQILHDLQIKEATDHAS